MADKLKQVLEMTRTLSTLLIVIFSASLQAAEAVRLESVRMWQAPDSLRMVFDINNEVEHKIFLLANPDRVVIDLKNTRAADLKLEPGQLSESWLKGMRTSARGKGEYRVVLDLHRRVTPSSFILKPNNRYGHRLVVDLKGPSETAPVDLIQAVVGSGSVPAQTQANDNLPIEIRSVSEKNSGRDIVIAIDAGHGGEDPGALGYRGTHEKDVVLEVARKLKALVDREEGMKAVMIRDGDYYISLRDRVKKVRDSKADLLISIHADAFKNHKARGSSVFALSPEGATSEAARWLAESENSADLIGGVSLDDKDEVLASVLLDLSQTASIEASLDVGQSVLSELKTIGSVHKHRVEQAGFVVLKSPDVPSILVETAFISNPEEERKLKTGQHQNKLASAVMNGVRGYFSKNPPPGSLLAMRNSPKQAHVIRAGETLISIARQYRVSMETIRDSNALTNDRLRAGQVLHIPAV